MNHIAYTSRLSYLQTVGNISGSRRRVYEAIRDWTGQEPPCNDELAEATGLRLGSICGRVNELRRDGCIEEGPLKESPVTGHRVKTYRAVVYRQATPRTEPQQELFPETTNETSSVYY